MRRICFPVDRALASELTEAARPLAKRHHLTTQQARDVLVTAIMGPAVAK